MLGNIQSQFVIYKASNKRSYKGIGHLKLCQIKPSVPMNREAQNKTTKLILQYYPNIKLDLTEQKNRVCKQKTTAVGPLSCNNHITHRESIYSINVIIPNPQPLNTVR